jgi:CRP-like cAMP-binding protein
MRSEKKLQKIFLSKIPLFRKLPTSELEHVLKIARFQKIKKNEIIFSEATSGSCLYVVLLGRVKIHGDSFSGHTKTFAYLDSGDFFGEMAMLDDKSRSASAVAIEDTEVMTIHKSDFRKLLEKRPALSLAVLKTLCERLRLADKEIEALSFQKVLGRLAQILLELAKKYGQKHSEGVLIDAVFSHKELANRVGTARENITRLLNRFERAGCVAFSGKYIVLRDCNKLKSWV